MASWLSRYRSYREYLRGRSGKAWVRDGFVAGLVLSITSLLSFRPTPHFAAITGYFGSPKTWLITGPLLGLSMLAYGWPVEAALVCVLSGPLGTALKDRGRSGHLVIAFWGAAWVPLCWSLGWIPEVSFFHVRALNELQLTWMATALSLGAALQAFLLLWSLEYLAQREERRSANILWRMTEVFERILSALRTPSLGPELCLAVKEAVVADCVIATSQGDLITCDPSSPPPRPISQELLCRQAEPSVVSSSTLWQELSGHTVILPLDDGERPLGSLFLLVSEQHPLASAKPSFLKTLCALFTGELASQRTMRQQLELERTRYRMLVAQIQPHFLFNSLTSVAALTVSDPDKARALLVDLCHSLRHTFANQDDWLTLEHEMESVHSYLAVEKARFGRRLQLSIELAPETLQQKVPSLLLQPLIENAIRHGIAGRADPGTVTLETTMTSDWLTVVVKDNGSGFPHRYDGDGTDWEGTGEGHRVGLTNVRERLYTLAGRESDFRIQSAPGEGTVVSYRLPLNPPHLIPAQTAMEIAH